MARMRNTWLIITVGVLLCATGIGVVLWAWNGQEPGTGAGAGQGGAATDLGKQQEWRKVEVSVGDKTGVFDVDMFREPIPFTPLPLDQTRRDTPVNTWVSWKSHGDVGKDDVDLKKFAAHYVDPGYLLGFVREKLKLPAGEYFQRLRKAESKSRAVGTVKYGDYVLLMYKFQGSGQFVNNVYTVAVCMVNKDGTYYIDDKPKRADPVLREVVDDECRQLGF